jgi:hypothetical protein
MNAALVPLARIRIMPNADLITTARKFDRLSILEGELLKRLEAYVKEEERKEARTRRFLNPTTEEARRDTAVQEIVNWAKKCETELQP